MAAYAPNARIEAFQWSGSAKASAGTPSDLKKALPDYILLVEGDQLLIIRRPESDPFAEARVVYPTQYVVIIVGGYHIEDAEQFEARWNLVSAL